MHYASQQPQVLERLLDKAFSALLEMVSLGRSQAALPRTLESESLEELKSLLENNSRRLAAPNSSMVEEVQKLSTFVQKIVEENATKIPSSDNFKEIRDQQHRMLEQLQQLQAEGRRSQSVTNDY